jgi:hypothetical protein
MNPKQAAVLAIVAFPSTYRLPLYLGVDGPAPSLVWMAPILVYLALAWGFLNRVRFQQASFVLITPLLFVVLVEGIAHLRAVGAGTIGWQPASLRVGLIVVAAVFFMTLGSRRDLEPSQIAAYLVAGIGASMALSMALAGLGLRTSEPQGTAIILGSLGFQANRMLLPGAPGTNSYGVLAGLVMTGGFGLAIKRGNRLVGIAAGAVGLATILLVDSRSAVIYSAITLGIIVTFRPSLHRLLFALPFASVAVLFASLAGFFRGAHTLPDRFLRSGSEEVSSGRLNLWIDSIGIISKSAQNFLFGFGSYGDITSGLAARNRLDVGQQDNSSFGAHNKFLDDLMDLGIFGAVAYVILMLAAIRWLIIDARRTSHFVPLLLITYLCLAGISERTPTMYSPDAMWVLFGLVGAAISVSQTKANPPASSGVERIARGTTRHSVGDYT